MNTRSKPSRASSGRALRPRLDSGACSPLAAAALLARQLSHSLETSLYRRTLRMYHRNPLYLWLCDRFAGRLSTGEVEDVCYLYGVGTALKWGGSVVYWQMDADRLVRTGKIMGYDRKSGRRIKHPRPLMNWVHALPGFAPEGFTLRQCMFGTHLAATFPDYTLWLFESEKAALIAALLLKACRHSGIICMGAGGCEGFAPDRWRMNDPLDSHYILRSRRVVLFPDEGKGEQWLRRGKELTPYAASVEILPLDMAGTRLSQAAERHSELRALPGEGPDDLFIRALERPRALTALLDALPVAD